MPTETTHRVSLRAAPRARSMLETKMRYDVLLNGETVGQLSYNMTGYVGMLPLPDGRRLQIPEGSLASYRREIAAINREAAGPTP